MHLARWGYTVGTRPSLEDLMKTILIIIVLVVVVLFLVGKFRPGR